MPVSIGLVARLALLLPILAAYAADAPAVTLDASAYATWSASPLPDPNEDTGYAGSRPVPPCSLPGFAHTTDGTPAAACGVFVVDFSGAPVGLPSALEGTAYAQAEAESLQVATSLTVDDLDPAISIGEGLFTTSFTQSLDNYTINAAGVPDIYLSPIFELDGSLSSTGTPIASFSFRLHYYAFSTGEIAEIVLRDLRAPRDGALLAIDERVAGPLISAASGSIVELAFIMQASTDVPGTSALLPGDHAGAVDFFGTARFLGVELYTDAAGTIPFVGAASVTGTGGRSIAIIPEPAAGGLAALGLALVGLARLAVEILCRLLG